MITFLKNYIKIAFFRRLTKAEIICLIAVKSCEQVK